MSDRNRLRNVNLNLLPVLRELLRKRNVTRAAEALNLTQAAVSASLKKLRDHFADELLTTRGRGLILTPKAEALIGPLEEALQAAETVFEQERFDPAAQTRHFRISTIDYPSAALQPALTRAVRQEAPGVSLRFEQGGDRIFDDLRVGDLDFVFVPEGLMDISMHKLRSGESPFRTEVVWSDPIVCIVSKDNPKVGKRLSRRTYLDLPHAAFELEYSVRANPEDKVLNALNLTRFVASATSHLLILPQIVAYSDCVASIPESVARRFETVLPLRVLPAPIRIPPLRMAMIWARHSDRDPSHRWLRETVRRVIPYAVPPSW